MSRAAAADMAIIRGLLIETLAATETAGEQDMGCLNGFSERPEKLYQMKVIKLVRVSC